MYFLRPEHFTGVLLFMCAVYSASSHSFINAASLNTSDEIKQIFNGDNGIKETSVFNSKGMSKSGNFAEGGVLNLNLSSPTVTVPTKKNGNSGSNEHILNNNFTENLSKTFQNTTNNKDRTLHRISTIKALPSIKLNATRSNLFLGVPEVIHINGTSSIKPRKGVYFNKIVPRKGVENDSEANHNNSIHSCLWLNNNECYTSKELNNVDCKCCKQGNELGKIIKQNSAISCENCKPVIFEYHDNKYICKNICCYDRFHKADSVSNTQDIFYKNLSFNFSTEFGKENSSSYGKIKETIWKGAFVNFTKTFKHKPIITKVPYDVEVVTEILSKTKQKVFVPVIVSLLLLPLIGVLVFVVLRKIKEIWDKRYYKRMDFLIDGMYQD